MKGEEIPRSWRQAVITLIPKEGADFLDVKNYRLISLLNIDYKIYAKILANRLKKLLVDFIKEDQVGVFLPGRQLKDNISSNKCIRNI